MGEQIWKIVARWRIRLVHQWVRKLSKYEKMGAIVSQSVTNNRCARSCGGAREKWWAHQKNFDQKIFGRWELLGADVAAVYCHGIYHRRWSACSLLLISSTRRKFLNNRHRLQQTLLLMLWNLAALSLILLIFLFLLHSVQNQLVPERITCKSRPTNEKFKANFALL